MPARAGIHIHRPVVMDTSVRRYDTRVSLRFKFVLILPGAIPNVASAELAKSASLTRRLP